MEVLRDDYTEELPEDLLVPNTKGVTYYDLIERDDDSKEAEDKGKQSRIIPCDNRTKQTNHCYRTFPLGVLVSGVVHRLLRRPNRLLPRRLLLRMVLQEERAQELPKKQYRVQRDRRVRQSAAILRPIRPAAVRKPVLRQKRGEERVRHLCGTRRRDGYHHEQGDGGRLTAVVCDGERRKGSGLRLCITPRRDHSARAHCQIETQ